MNSATLSIIRPSLDRKRYGSLCSSMYAEINSHDKYESSVKKSSRKLFHHDRSSRLCLPGYCCAALRSKCELLSHFSVQV